MKRAPSSCRRSSSAKTSVLGLRVDDQRPVAAAAGRAGLAQRSALVGWSREDLAQPVGGAPAGAEPVGVQRVGGDGHPRHILATCPSRPATSRPSSARSSAPRRARCSSSGGAGTGQDRACSSPATPGWPPTAAWPRRRSSPSTAHRRGRRRAARARSRTRCDRGVRGAAPSTRSTASARGCCATRRSRPGSTPSSSPSAPADRTRAAARARRRAAAAPPRPARQPGGAAGAASSPGSTASRTRWSPRPSTSGGRAALPAGDAARRARARVRRALPRPTTGCWPRTGALDTGDLVLRAHRLLRDRPHVRARLGAALAPRARRRRAGPRARRAAPRARCWPPRTAA